MDRTRIIEKIRKLLSLSSSENEHEAAAAAAKAQELLSEYNLSMSDIPEQESKSMTATETRAKDRQRLEEWAYSLAGVVSVAFDCDYYHSGAWGETVFVGVGADPEVCSWTYRYLYKTLLRMGSSYLRQPQCEKLRTAKSRRIARACYLEGVVVTVGQRLHEQKKRTPITESALVPVKKNVIEDAMPNGLNIVNFRPIPIRAEDIRNGMRDGQDVSLSTPLNRVQRTEIQ